MQQFIHFARATAVVAPARIATWLAFGAITMSPAPALAYMPLFTCQNAGSVEFAIEGPGSVTQSQLASSALSACQDEYGSKACIAGGPIFVGTETGGPTGLSFIDEIYRVQCGTLVVAR